MKLYYTMTVDKTHWKAVKKLLKGLKIRYKKAGWLSFDYNGQKVTATTIGMLTDDETFNMIAKSLNATRIS